MEDGAQAQARARGPEERILWPPDHGAAAHPEQQWAGHDAYAPAAMHQVTTVHGAGGQAWPPAQAPQGPATDDAWPSEAASSCPGQQQQHFAGPTKSVKFSAQQEHQQLTQGGQRIVTIVSQHAMQDDERKQSRAAARRRRRWRRFLVLMSPRYWAHWLNKTLPMIHPDAPARMALDGVVAVLVIYNCFLVPYEIGFSTPAPHVINNLEWGVDAFFAVDICCNFRTAYVDSTATLVRDGGAVATHYLKTWFGVDLMATIPFEAIVTAAASNLSQGQLTALALLRTPRLLRIMRLLRILDRLKGANYLRIVKLMFLLAVIAHWIACFWHLLFMLDRSEVKWTFDAVGANSAEVTVYLVAYLNTLFLMVGNDIYPANSAERLYCTFVLVLGACFYAIIVGNMSLLLNNLSPTASRHRFKKDIIMNTARYLDLPAGLLQRINGYFEHLMQYSHPGPDGMNLIHQLPSSMAQDATCWCYRKVLVKVPLFADCEAAFITQLVMRLKLSVYMTGEVIFRVGDVGHEIYLVSKGNVAVINTNSELLALLGPGAFFGELALLATARRTAHCVSLSQCDLAMLTANDLVSTMRDFPDSAALVRSRAVARLNVLVAAGTAAEDTLPGVEEEGPDDDGSGSWGGHDDGHNQDGGDGGGGGGGAREGEGRGWAAVPTPDHGEGEEAAAEPRELSRKQSWRSAGGADRASAQQQQQHQWIPQRTLSRIRSGATGQEVAAAAAAAAREPLASSRSFNKSRSRRPSLALRPSAFKTSAPHSLDDREGDGGGGLATAATPAQPAQTAAGRGIRSVGSSKKARQPSMRWSAAGPPLGNTSSSQQLLLKSQSGNMLARAFSSKAAPTFESVHDWMVYNLGLIGQMHTVVTRLNGRADMVRGHLAGMQVRLDQAQTRKQRQAAALFPDNNPFAKDALPFMDEM